MGKLWAARWRQVFSVWFLTERYLLFTVLTAAASSFVPALQGVNRVMTSPMKQQTVEEDGWKKSARRRGPSIYILLISHGPIHLLFEHQYCETECPYPFCLVPRHVIGAQKKSKSHFVVMDLISQDAALPFLCQVSVSIMSRSLPQPPLRSPPINQKNNSPMRLPVWRFGWGWNTAHERYGTVLHRTSNCGDDCWIEHGLPVCPTLYAVNIFYCAFVKINFVCILKCETRTKYFDIWKKILFVRKKYQASTAPQQFVVLPHHGPNSGLAKTSKASEREMNCHSSSSPFVLPTYPHE